MTPSILRLSADVWFSITALLSYDSLANLIFAGYHAPSHLIGAGIHSVKIDGSLHSIDSDRLFFILDAALQLKYLNVTSKHAVHFTKPHRRPRFPPKLMHLSVDAPDSAQLFLSSDGVQELPESLLALKLSGESEFKLENWTLIRLPSKLTTLMLPGGVFSLTADEIAELPRSLTTLELRLTALPEMTRYVWPSELSTLHLSADAALVTVEHLPRTVTELSVRHAKNLNTSFTTAARGGEDFAFPWRSFFPLLERLKLKVETKGSLELFMNSLVSADAYEVSLVENFISKGFWGAALPSLAFDPHRVYPFYTQLIFHRPNDYVREATDVVKRLAFFLSRCESVMNESYMLSSALQHLPAATRYTTYAPRLSNAHHSLPTSLQVFNAIFVEPAAIERLTSLTHITADFQLANGMPATLECVAWPKTLTSLSSSSIFNEAAVRCLPLTVTDLGCKIQSSTAWSALALHLVNLKRFTLNFDYSDTWLSETPLTPWKGSLETLKLHYRCDNKPSKEGIFLGAFFPPLDQPSPLPSSLTSLSLGAYGLVPVPMTLCPRLPRQLKELNFQIRVEWNDWWSTPEPHVAVMTPRELLESIPRGLEQLSLNCASMANYKGR